MEEKELGQRLAELRQERGFSQEQLAYLLQYHGIQCGQKNVSKWERNGRLKATQLATVATILDVPVSRFFEAPSASRIKF
jgi:transcriptional regulator with XRE-family HTH domain